MTHRYHRMLAIVLAGVLLFSTVGVVLAAAGTVYYGGYGWNYRLCRSRWVPCGTYDYAVQRACQLSDSYQIIYYVYHVNNGYAGFCDKTGGAGTEPPPRQGRSPESMLISALLMAIVGFAAGSIFYGVLRRENA